MATTPEATVSSGGTPTPLTTLIAVMLLALLCALAVGETFAITVLASAVSIITAHSQADEPDTPAK